MVVDTAGKDQYGIHDHGPRKKFPTWAMFGQKTQHAAHSFLGETLARIEGLLMSIGAMPMDSSSHSQKYRPWKAFESSPGLRPASAQYGCNSRSDVLVHFFSHSNIILLRPVLGNSLG